MNFSEILTALAEAISDVDKSSESDAASDINKSREPLLRIPFRFLNNPADAAIGLWLVDEAGNDQSHEATLWQIVPYNTNTRGSDTAADPDRKPAVVKVVSAALKQFTPLGEQDKIRKAFPISLSDANARGLFSGSMGGKINFSAYHDVLLPLRAQRGRDVIGLLQLITPNIDPMLALEPNLSQLDAVTSMMAALIESGRSVRLISAINKCQKGLIQRRTTDDLAKALCEELRVQCSALTCAVYRPGRGDTLVRIGQSSDGPCNNRETIERGSFTYWVYERAIGSAETHHLTHYSSLSSASHIQDSPPFQYNVDLPETLKAERTSWLSLTLQRRVGADMEGYVPILFIRLLTTSHKGFLGGSFSTTARDIVKTVGNHVSEVFSNLFSFEAIAKLATKAPEIRAEFPSLITSKEFLRLECAFANLIKELLWCIKDVYVAHRAAVPGAETTLRDCDNNPLTGMPDFTWSLPKRQPGGQGQLLDFALYNGGEGVDITVNSVDNFQYGLRCILGGRPFARYEWRVLTQIVAELRFAQMGTFNLAEISRQTAEIRHALRAEMNGVLGHLHVAREIYEMCLETHKKGGSTIALRHLLENARFRKSMRRAVLSSQSLGSVLENAGIHMTEMKPERLQRSRVNISRMLKEMRVPYMPELERRDIEVNDTSPDDIFASCDGRLVKMALFNLFDNAVKYAFQKYSIVVQAAYRGSDVLVTVTNTGPYIKPEDVRTIFEPFQRVTFKGAAPMPGTGLGLPVSRKIAEVHGGKLDVVSKPFRVGDFVHAETTFLFLIPKGFK